MDTLTDALSRCFALDDFTAEAQARLSAEAWAFFSGGAADGSRCAPTRRPGIELQLLPRVLRDLEGLDPGVSLLGMAPLAMMLAPVAFQRLAHEDGELATAAAAAALGTGLVLSSQASQPLEAVARAMGSDAPLWFQLYWQTGPEGSRASGRAATWSWCNAPRHGYQALVLTVDAPLSGVRSRAAAAFLRCRPVSPPSTWRPLLPAIGAPCWHAPRPGPSSNGSARTRALPVLVKGRASP